MKMILMTLLMISLSGCKIPRLKSNLNRCLHSDRYDKFRCHEYDFNEMKRVSLSYDLNRDDPKLEGAVCFPLESWKELYIFGLKIKENRRRQRKSQGRVNQ